MTCHIGVIEETAERRYCAEPVLNAMFAAYFAEADRQGVKIDAEIDITELPKEEAATFSIVCANLIENATHAVSGLDEDEKLIRVRGVQSPKLMLSVSNPYEGSIMTDDEVIPITSKAGHGIGFRSIMDYCEKHDAVCDFKIQDGWFAVRIAKK
ncbi:MAG: GHKL domain-containing protein [Lachnospiraceae bacterium]|nr:GHKL domain-containing protein [Lachnospiraceae bacterium]